MPEGSQAFRIANISHGVYSDSQAKRLHFRIAGIQDREHFVWCFFRFAGETPAFQDRGRLACMRLYSTANERGFDRNSLFVCLSAKCR
ncbi:MAG: hypothetical protein LBP59_19540 [Planctomycetaceae bacterium]|nr:hypothetical protein [Planctomycetaceae bacterium]